MTESECNARNWPTYWPDMHFLESCLRELGINIIIFDMHTKTLNIRKWSYESRLVVCIGLFQKHYYTLVRPECAGLWA
jgi:hypothetical protein